MNNQDNEPRGGGPAILWMDDCSSYANGPIRVYRGVYAGFAEAQEAASKRAIESLVALCVPGITAGTLATLFRRYDAVPVITCGDVQVDLTPPEVWSLEVELCRMIIACKEREAEAAAARKGVRYAPARADQEAIIRARAARVQGCECLAHATFLCRDCRRPAGTVAYVRSLRASEADRRYYGRIHGFVGNPVVGGTGQGPDAAILEALTAMDAAKLYDLDPGYAPFFCDACRACYCYRHWNARPRYEEDGWYDDTVGTCPSGHDAIIDD